MANGSSNSCTQDVASTVHGENFIAVTECNQQANNLANSRIAEKEKGFERLTERERYLVRRALLQYESSLECQDHEASALENDNVTMFGVTAKSIEEKSLPPSKISGEPTLIIENPPHSKNPSNGHAREEKASAYSTLQWIEDSSSEVDFDRQARNIRARERVEILRRRVIRTRHLTYESRQTLRESRERYRDACARLMGAIDQIMARDDVRNLKTLEPYYKEIRAAQDEMGPAEDAYDRLENRLDDEEQDLEQEEDHFNRRYNVTVPLPPESKLDDVLSPLLKPYQTPETEIQNLDLENELVQEYLEKVAEAEHLKEELDDLESDFNRLSEDAVFRKRHNIGLSTETAEFLAEYEKIYKNTVDTLRATEDALFDLRNRCVNGHLFNESEYVYESRDALTEEVMDSVMEARERSPLYTAAQGNEYHERETNFKDKRDYVNHWMLEWMQGSPLEAFQLRAWIYFENPETRKDPLDYEWSELAILWWDNDDAGQAANENEDYKRSRIAASFGDTRRLGGTRSGRSHSLSFDNSLKSLHVSLEDIHLADEMILGSESSSYATAYGI